MANVTIQCFYKASDPSLTVCWLPLCPSRCTFVSAVQTELLLKADKCEGGQGGRVGLGSEAEKGSRCQDHVLKRAPEARFENAR